MPSPKRQKPPSRAALGPALISGAQVLPAAKAAESDGWWPSSDALKILLYGHTATGKTTLWATFPHPILAILCSGGLEPGELRSIDTPENRRRIIPRPLNEPEDLPGLVNKALVQGYRTVVLDHATGYQDLVLKDILGLKEIPVQKNWGMARQEQYGQAVQQCKEAFRALINLPCNVVFVGQERTSSEDKVSDVISPNVGVSLFPSLAGWLNPAVDYIAQTFIRPRMIESTTTIAGQQVTTTQRGKGHVYCLRTGPDDTYTTKFRVPRRGGTLPEYIEDPSYDKIRALISGEELEG